MASYQMATFQPCLSASTACEKIVDLDAVFVLQNNPRGKFEQHHQQERAQDVERADTQRVVSYHVKLHVRTMVCVDLFHESKHRTLLAFCGFGVIQVLQHFIIGT